MRMLGVFALLAGTIWFAFTQGFGQKSGGLLFGYEHQLLLGAIWVLVPFMGSDSLSRERRDGTLPLLALTPLRPLDVVLAKAFVHGLRAFTLWAAVIPVVVIPLMLGGVSRWDLVLSGLVQLASLIFALGAGMVASSFCKGFVRAQALTAILAFCLALTLAMFLGLAVLSALRGPWLPDDFWELMGWLTAAGFELAVAPGATANWRLGLMRGFGPRFETFLALGMGVLCIVVLFTLLRVAAWRVRRSWREDTKSARVMWLEERFCRPMFFREQLKRWMKYGLQRNPIGWLEYRTWNGRLVLWSWMAVVISIYSYMMLNFNLFMNGFAALQAFLATLLAGSMAFSAAGSFRRERETGVLELLLISPLNEQSIILGRLRGLWTQFAPALILLFSVWLYCGAFLLRSYYWGQLVYWLLVFVTVPVVGLYFSLAGSSFMGAFIRTLLVGIVAPALAISLMPDSSFLGMVLQIVIAGAIGARLYQRLCHRRFPLDRPMIA